MPGGSSVQRVELSHESDVRLPASLVRPATVLCAAPGNGRVPWGGVTGRLVVTCRSRSLRGRSALLDLLEMMRCADGGELMRRLLATMMQTLVDAEATAFIGSEPHERSESRTTQRKGTCDKLVTTTAADLTVKIPKVCTGSFFPALLEPRRRIDVEPLEEDPQVAHPHAQGCLAQRCRGRVGGTARPVTSCSARCVRGVCRRHEALRVRLDEQPGELAQAGVENSDAGRAKAHCQLVEVAAGGGGELRRVLRDEVPIDFMSGSSE